MDQRDILKKQVGLELKSAWCAVFVEPQKVHPNCERVQGDGLGRKKAKPISDR